MSEPMGVSITIGGNLKQTDLEAFCEALNEEMYEINGLNEPEEFHIGILTYNTWHGMANWGNIDSLKAFCENHDLSFKFTCDASGEYSEEVTFWIPGMKEECTQTASSGSPVVKVEDIRPYLNMFTRLVEDGRPSLEFLPLLINDPEVGPLAAKMMKSRTPYKVLAKKLNAILPPTIPTIPPFIIT